MSEIESQLMEIARRWEKSLEKREIEVKRRENALIERLDKWTDARTKHDTALQDQLKHLTEQLNVFGKRWEELETRLGELANVSAYT